MLATFIAMVTAAVLVWGGAHPQIEVREEPAFAAAISSGPLPDGTCVIIADPVRMAGYTTEQQVSILTHEVGHCLGLGHFGTCNGPAPAIMGCATLGEITPYDRLKLAQVRGQAYTTVLPMVGN